MKLLIISVALSLLCGSIAAQEKAPKLRLSSNGSDLLVYNADFIESPDAEQPWYGRSGFIHPVYSPKGHVVTDGFPQDHLHQHGLMFAWTSAEFNNQPVDFWNSKKREGHVEHFETSQVNEKTISVRLRHVIDQKDQSVVVLNESWRLTAVPHPTMNVFDLVSTQTCIAGKALKIRKHHYGGMCVRGNADWRSGDVMLTSEGKRQANGNHSRPDWVTMFGRVNGQRCGIAAMSHPDNFRAPQPVRLHPKMPYFCFAPMVLGEFRLVRDKPYVSHFRIVAYDGKPDLKELDAVWKAFEKVKTIAPGTDRTK